MFLYAVFAVVSWLVTPAASAADAQLGEAEILVNAGKGARVYPTLSAMEATNAGDPKFDRLLGLAALAAGEAGHATMALERVVLVEPENARGHYELARAYAALGDSARARSEAEIALSLKPIPLVEKGAQQILTSMQAPTTMPRTGSGLYAELGLGYDSNVNSGVEQQSVYIPIFFTNVLLDPGSLKQSDSYGLLALGGQYRTQLGEKSTFSASLDTVARRYGELQQYSPTSIQMRLGVGLNETSAPVRFTLLGQNYTLEDNRGYALYGLIGEWLLPVNGRNSVQLFGRYSQLRYDDKLLETNDYNQSTVGIGWLHALTTRLLAGVSLHGAAEREVNLRADGDSRTAGLRATVQYTTSDYDLYGALGVQANTYDRLNTAFAEMREDNIVEASIGMVYRFSRAWSLRPKLTYVNQRSNIVVYEFDRYDVQLAARYDFRF